MATTTIAVQQQQGQHPEKPALSLANAASKTNLLSVHHTAKNVTPTYSAGKGSKPDGVRVLALHEWKQAALSLAEAFQHDEVAMYLVNTPDRAHWTPEQKWALHLRIMEFVTYAHLLKGLVVAVGPKYDCVQLWMPPGKNMDDYLTLFRSGMWRLNYLLSAEGKQRFFTEFLPLLHTTKHAVMGARDDDSWYLVYLGTRPSGRGKGYARKGLEFVLSRADEEGRAAYLESSNVVNREFYGRLGFVMRESIQLTRGEVPVTMEIMVREPVKGEVKRG